MAERIRPRRGSGGAGASEARSVDARSTSEVIASAIANVQALIRTQIELAKLEITSILRDKAIAVGLLVAAGIFGLFVLGFLGVTGAYALMLVLQEWAAWLIVTGIYLLIMVALALIAVRLLKRPSTPEETKRQASETIDWAKGQVGR